MAGFVTCEFGCAASWKFTCYHCFSKQRPCTAREALCTGFLLCPNLHPSKQFGRLQKSSHEVDLVDTGCQEESAEINKSCQGKVATAVEVASPRFVRCLEA